MTEDEFAKFMEKMQIFDKKEKKTSSDTKIKKNVPVYYKADIVPQNPLAIKDHLEIKDAFIKSVSSSYTPLNVLTDHFMKSLPHEIGQLKCQIERNNSGMNKFWPKYTVILDGTKLALLSAKKLANSKTSHYRIELANSNNKYK